MYLRTRTHAHAHTDTYTTAHYPISINPSVLMYAVDYNWQTFFFALTVYHSDPINGTSVLPGTTFMCSETYHYMNIPTIPRQILAGCKTQISVQQDQPYLYPHQSSRNKTDTLIQKNPRILLEMNRTAYKFQSSIKAIYTQYKFHIAPSSAKEVHH
jgi:hypothetical protein